MTVTAFAPTASVSLPIRAGFFARVEGALAAGDFENLPVPAPVAFLAPGDLCGQCQGRGCLPKKTRKGQWKLCPSCTALNGRHAGWDFPRYPRGTHGTPSFFRHTETGNGRLRQDWGPCPSCDIDPISGQHRCENARVPWVPDCPDCRDTGWALLRVAPLPADVPMDADTDF